MSEAANAAASNAPANGGAPATAGGAPASAPAPQPAPLNLGESAPAAPEAKPAPAAPEAGVIEYEATGDAGLDLTLEFLGKLGIGPDNAALKAAEGGDFALLEALLGGMGDKAQGWERFLALGKSSYETAKTKSEADAAKLREGIESVVGGADRWKSVQEWAAKNAEPAEREAVNQAFKMGGLVGKGVAFYLAALFDKASGVNEGPSAAVHSGNNAAAGGAYALSPRAYEGEVSKLYSKLGGKMDGSPEYKALQARRAAWRG